MEKVKEPYPAYYFPRLSGFDFELKSYTSPHVITKNWGKYTLVPDKVESNKTSDDENEKSNEILTTLTSELYALRQKVIQFSERQNQFEESMNHHFTLSLDNIDERFKEMKEFLSKQNCQ